MQTFKTHSKYFIIAALTLSIVGGVFAQVTIPTGLTNAVQYIMQTVWTDDGTDTGLVNVQIDDTNIYVRTGFLYDGTGWNNRALGVDSSGNVVYVNANAINNPLLFPTANYIPKVNANQDGLDVSTMYQIGGLIGVNTLNPTKSIDILGDFQVTTAGSSLTYQYQFLQNSSTSNILSILQTQQCACDTTLTAAECTAPFSATAGDLLYCVDITSQDPNNSSQYFYTVYEKIGIGNPEPVLVTLGNSVGVRTANPQAALHVSGNVMINTIPTHSGTPTFALVQGPNNEVQKAPFPVGSAGEINTASNLGAGARVFSVKIGANLTFRSIIGAGITTVSEQSNTITINTPAQTLSLAGNTLSISGPNGNSVTLPAGSSANAWNTGGNMGTNPSTDFIGTIDNQALSFRTNNNLIGRLLTNGSIWRGLNNLITSSNNATIAGGTNNQIQTSSNSSTIGGGSGNIANGEFSTIGGGTLNRAGARASIGGGNDNIATGSYATIGGGSNNRAQGVGSSVIGGFSNNYNTIAGYASVAGGFSNSAIGMHSVALGNGNRAEGDNSFAAGRNSTAAHANSFVRSDGSSAFNTTDDNQFLVQALGGIGINTNAPQTTLHINGSTYTQGAVRRQYIVGQGTINLLDTDHIIMVEGDATITMPGCTTNQNGREIKIYNLLGLSTITINITGQGTRTINPSGDIYRWKRIFICVGPAGQRVPIE